MGRLQVAGCRSHFLWAVCFKIIVLPLPLLILGCSSFSKDTNSQITPQSIQTSLPVDNSSDETISWSEHISIYKTVPSSAIAWSPQSNAFLYDNCSSSLDVPSFTGSIIYEHPSENEMRTVLSEQFVCPAFGTKIEWTPDGQRFLFNGLSSEDVAVGSFPENAHIWLGQLSGEAEILLPREHVSAKWSPSFVEWLSENIVLYAGYGGGGHIIQALLDIESKTRSPVIITHACGIRSITQDYLGGCSGVNLSSNVSAFAIPIDALNQERVAIDTLSTETSFSFNYSDAVLSSDISGQESYFLDWLINSQEMLVLTWEKGLDLVENAPVETTIQLWDAETAVLTPLIDGGKYGRFSPTGQHLSYIIEENNRLIMFLRDWKTSETLFSQPVWIQERSAPIISFESFSENGRYFTTFVPPTETGAGLLTIFDTVLGETAVILPAQLTTPIWSPDHSQFIYRNHNNDLTIYNLANQQNTILAEDSGQQLTEPTWSYNGYYLSVTVARENIAIINTHPR